MDRNEMLWNKFMLSGKVDDYLSYCADRERKEKAEKDEYGRSDNQRNKHGRAE